MYLYNLIKILKLIASKTNPTIQVGLVFEVQLYQYFHSFRTVVVRSCQTYLNKCESMLKSMYYKFYKLIIYL